MSMYAYTVVARLASAPGSPPCEAAVSILAESQAQATQRAARLAADRGFSLRAIVSVTRRPIP